MTVTPEIAFAAARKHMSGPFIRGQRDCLMASCAASQALYGRNPLASGRPDYTTLTGAMRIARRFGGWRVWADQTFRMSGMMPGNDQVGSLCLITPIKWRDGLTFALCIRPGEYAEKSRNGMLITPGMVWGAWAWV